MTLTPTDATAAGSSITDAPSTGGNTNSAIASGLSFLKIFMVWAFITFMLYCKTS
jgi:hypothetical protein